MSAYTTVQKGPLKLKKVVDPGIKKKKKSKEKDMRKRMMEQFESGATGSDNSQDGETSRQRTKADGRQQECDSRTPAEIAFDRARQQRVLDEMMKKPIKTHKERIMEFNEHLDNLSEHYDIPKVSWTK